MLVQQAPQSSLPFPARFIKGWQSHTYTCYDAQRPTAPKPPTPATGWYWLSLSEDSCDLVGDGFELADWLHHVCVCKPLSLFTIGCLKCSRRNLA